MKIENETMKIEAETVYAWALVLMFALVSSIFFLIHWCAP
jgi:hypothetical protein